MKGLIIAAIAASLPMTPPAQAVAQLTARGPAAARATVDIQVCNRSGRDAKVAVSYVEVGSGQFMNRGWYDVGNGACTQLVTTDNANFYLYGDALDGSRTWGGNMTLCVQYPGPYQFWTSAEGLCEQGQETRAFVPMHAPEPGAYTWNLDP